MLNDNDFDKQFKQTANIVKVGFIFVGVIILVSLGGLAWLVSVLLKYFGVI